MKLVIRRFESGERGVFLLDERGVPLFWPQLFATVCLRNAGLAVNSIKNKLGELKVLLRWEHYHDRNLVSEFKSNKFLTIADVVSIRDFSKQRQDSMPVAPAANNLAARFPDAFLKAIPSNDGVSKHVHYNRLTTIANYVEFLGQTLTRPGNAADRAAAVDRMVKKLRQHRPRGMASNQDDDPDRLSPPTELVEAFVTVGSAGHPENPFRSGNIQRRNEVMIRLFMETGIRLGEMLSLRVDHIETGTNPHITVRRTHDDMFDPRDYQPVAKTKERSIPVSEILAAKIYAYIMDDRAGIPGANRHPYLFVTHRKGTTCGQPLTVSSVSNKMFGAMQRVRPEFAHIHPHSFRHHLNFLLSKRVDEHNRLARAGYDPTIEPISDAREMSIRAHVNGHRSLRSGDAYTTRSVREDVKAAMHELNEALMLRTRQSESDDNG